jgi:hypothetical protein
MLHKYPRSSWMPLPIGRVCQRVQVSAYPDRYQLEVADARAIVFALWRAVKPASPRRAVMHAGTSAALAESVRALLAAVSRRAPSNDSRPDASRVGANHRDEPADLRSTS